MKQSIGDEKKSDGKKNNFLLRRKVVLAAQKSEKKNILRLTPAAPLTRDLKRLQCDYGRWAERPKRLYSSLVCCHRHQECILNELSFATAGFLLYAFTKTEVSFAAVETVYGIFLRREWNFTL